MTPLKIGDAVTDHNGDSGVIVWLEWVGFIVRLDKGGRVLRYGSELTKKAAPCE